MNQIEVRITGTEDCGQFVELRKEFLQSEIAKDNRDLTDFLEQTASYYKESLEQGEQDSCFAYVNGELAGCATICYLYVLPTLDHPSGKRAHLMNVYVRRTFRRCGVGTKMLEQLIMRAKQCGVTEISLDATEDGRKLYESYGFTDNKEGMVLAL